MTPTVKLVTLITTVTAVGGGVVVANQVFNKEEEIKEPTVRETLEKAGFTVLDTNTKDGGWEIVLIDYQKAKEKTFTNSQEPKKTQEELRKDCKDALDKEASVGNYESLAKKWCVKKQPIKDVLEKSGYTPLNLDAPEKAEEKNHWIEKIKKLKENKEQFEAIKSQIKTEDGEDADKANIAAIKEGCTTLKINETNTTEDTFENSLALARDWCSVKTIDKQN